jgi:hypothetical protein
VADANVRPPSSLVTTWVFVPALISIVWYTIVTRPLAPAATRADAWRSPSLAPRIRVIEDQDVPPSLLRQTPMPPLSPVVRF